MKPAKLPRSLAILATAAVATLGARAAFAQPAPVPRPVFPHATGGVSMPAAPMTPITPATPVNPAAPLPAVPQRNVPATPGLNPPPQVQGTFSPSLPSVAPQTSPPPASLLPSTALGFEQRLPNANVVVLNPTVVAQAQAALALQGLFSGPITGFAGGETRSALLRFQARAALPQTGLPDLTTLAALGIMPTSITPTGFPALPVNPTAIATPQGTVQLQIALRALGLLAQAPTGIFDVPTRQAVIALQELEGLTPSGMVDAVTLARLNQLLAQITSTTLPVGSITPTSPSATSPPPFVPMTR